MDSAAAAASIQWCVSDHNLHNKNIFLKATYLLVKKNSCVFAGNVVIKHQQKYKPINNSYSHFVH